MTNKENSDKNTQAKAHDHTGDKWLTVIAGVIMTICLTIELITDYTSGALSINNSFALLFSIWLCIGAWHMFDDRENEREFGFWTLYLWFLRYHNKKALDVTKEPKK